eukprot:TRINITY_DN19566_c0_g1_i1.p1 TRINITY_DN19566_c0_g1~~TRINITY_DN19566_c0_g1_i1.p1  ORF type:complete len:262 (+),score=63.93 TRINITY_DN19566_c0_g1_i1:70-786(+)
MDAAAVLARWQQAQRSPSIVGFNVAGQLSESLTVDVDGAEVVPADIRLTDGENASAAGGQDIFLELIFPKVPDAVQEQRLAEATLKRVEKYLGDQRVEEFRSRLARRQAEASTLRRRGGQENNVEGGSEEKDSWRDYLRSSTADSRLRLCGAADLGARGRKVFAVRLAMEAGAAEELGRLAYPNVFAEESPDGRGEDSSFLACYYGCGCFVLLLVLLWAFMLISGISRGRAGPAPLKG